MKSILARSGAFVLFGSALWALLPAIARHQLSASESQFGLMLSALGAGAATSGVWLSRSRFRTNSGQLLVIAILTFAIVNVALNRLDAVVWTYPWLLAGGFAWIAVMSSFNVAAQTALPAWVRARGLSLYLLVFQGGMAFSSWFWGFAASRFGIRIAMTAAGAGLFLIALGFALRHPQRVEETARQRV